MTVTQDMLDGLIIEEIDYDEDVIKSVGANVWFHTYDSEYHIPFCTDAETAIEVLETYWEQTQGDTWKKDFFPTVQEWMEWLHNIQLGYTTNEEDFITALHESEADRAL
jgi:hypothetical protein